MIFPLNQVLYIYTLSFIYSFVLYGRISLPYNNYIFFKSIYVKNLCYKEISIQYIYSFKII